MPLWMQLLIAGGIMQNPTDGEGNDLGGGSGNDDPNNDDGGDDPKDDNGNDDDDKGDEGKEGKSKPNNGGKNKPTDKEAELIKEVMKYKQEKNEAKKLLAELQQKFGDLDPEAARKALEAQRAEETQKLEAKGEYERVKQSMAEQHQQQVQTLQQQIAELQEQLGGKEGQINELTIGSSFSKSTYISSELTLTANKARALYGAHFEIENGEVVGYDKPRGAANRTALVDSYGSALSFDKAMAKIIEADPERDTLIRSKVNAGSGSNTKQDNKGLKNDKPKSTLDKIMAGLAGTDQ